MLLELARWLNEMGWMPPLFGYITFRAILGALTALLLSLWLGPRVIARLAMLAASIELDDALNEAA